MPFVPFSNTLQVEFIQGLDEQVIENVVYAQYATTPSAEDADTLGNALISWWDTLFSAQLSNTLVLTAIQLTDLSDEESFSITVLPTAPVAGKISDEAVPNNCALCVSFRSAGRGRSARGRNYVAGIPGDFVSANRVVSTVTDSLVIAYNSLKTEIDAAGATWVIASRQHDKVIRTTGVTFPVVTALIVDNTIDSQRRRLPGRGR